MPLLLRVIQSVLMSFFLALFMTAWVTFLNLGVRPDFINFWATSFVFAWPAAFTISFVIGPSVAKWSHLLHSKFSK